MSVVTGTTIVADDGQTMKLTIGVKIKYVSKEGASVNKNNQGNLYLNIEGGKSYLLDPAIVTAPVGDVDAIQTAVQEMLDNIAGVGGGASASGGATPYFDGDGDNTVQTIKPSAGSLYKLLIQNPNGAEAFVQLYDTAAPIVGTTIPVYVIYVPASGAAVDDNNSVPLEFTDSIKYACTTTATGNGDPATGLIVSGGFK